MTFFLLLSLLAYLFHSISRGKPVGRNWFLLSLGTGLLAMLAKTVASMLPLALLLLDVFLFPRKERWTTLLREKWGFFAGSCFVGAMSVIALLHVRRHPNVYFESLPEKILLPFYSWAFYLGKTILPVDLTPIYSYPPLWQQVLSLLLVAGLTVLAVWWYRQKGPLLVGVWGFFLLFLVPTILGREKAGIQPWADRYSYLPSIALGLLFGAILLYLLERGSRLARWGGGAVALLLLVGCGVMSSRLVPLWRDTETLFRHATEVNPRAIFAQANLGIMLTAVGRPDEALEVLQHAAELSPSYAGSYGAMGLAYEEKGEPEEAVRMYRKALELDSNYVDAHSNLGNALMALGRYDEAIAEYLEGIRKEPEFDDAYYNLGIAIYRKGDDVGAMEVFRRAAEVNPIRPDTYVNMGIIYEKWGKADSANVQFARAAELGHEKAMEKVRHK
jgi:tetratricopeptide (TPR) repeat protein